MSLFFSHSNQTHQPNTHDTPSDITTPQSIIIRIWLEPSGNNNSPHWYGHITVVESDERIYIKNLNDVTLFFARFVQKAGAQVPIFWRFRLWLQRLFQQG